MTIIEFFTLFRCCSLSFHSIMLHAYRCSSLAVRYDIKIFFCHLDQGGSFRTDHWRSEVDLLLINVARSAFVTGGGYEQRLFKVGEPSIPDLQLASLKALLASFLSSPHARPPYLAQGIGLFRKGKIIF
jgi:hypothetical protein